MAALCPARRRLFSALLRQPCRSFTSATESSEKILQSQDDWTAFQLDRAERTTLVDVFSKFGSAQTRDNTWQPHHPLHRPTAPRDLTLSALLAAGAHLGHHSSLLNPNFVPYAYGTRAGITIIDLERTLPHLRRAASLVRAVVSRDGTVVFVGTRTDLRPTVLKAAQRIGSQGYHVGEKWLPGTLTNKVHFFGPEVAQSERVVPDLVVFLNPIPNLHAIRECAIEHVPTIGIVDSNVDPRIVMYPIPANDESTRTAELIAGVLSIAGREGAELAAERAQKRARSARSMAKHRTLEVD
ncbi:ribosomal protein S2, flavodoxin-like domain-containing protein [Lactarius akahatsu]|uniref:Ribosomal protein S2, flavodoxin-like domain-containing protein n=1 Tax=Lactarius akahatsu TaxID=416441 RepID=A0AAD4LVR8_9AGAM|nr:ribosomal protein S2, flavodoxin-like domain-containing protein [Lactarius akahatsu]